MELIDRAIKEIENEFAEVLTSHGYDSYEKADLFYQWYCDGLMKAIGILLDMEAEQPRWIPCSERLPEDEGYVLVTTPNGNVTNAKYWQRERLWVKDLVIMRVEAWMPLPEPWKGDSDATD